MSTELERYCILFDRLVSRTIKEVSAASEDSLTWQPTLTAELSFGDRITNVTVKSLFVHLVVSEHLWFDALSSCDEGASLPVPSSASQELTARLVGDHNFTMALEMHSGNMDMVRKFTESTLTKKVTFTECNWTVMGFLWAIYGHHNYHFGHIDMFWRLSGAPGPEYHSFNPREMA